MTISPQFRTAMNWLHTWTGIWLGAVLFVIFWMGTLSVFDKEIDRWMMPETRIDVRGTHLDADEVIEKIHAVREGVSLSSLLIYLPRDRQQYFEVSAEFKDATYLRDRLHASTGKSLGMGSTRAASGFFYPMHYRLLIGGNLGYWIVALATIYMMVLLVTGVVIHRKIFKDFFTFRPQKSIGRSSLDIHNICGTVFLPFHFLICLSGFVIFAGFYASLPFAFAKDIVPDIRTVELIYSADDYGYYSRSAAGVDAEMLPIAPMIKRAEELWTARYGEPADADRIDVHHYGDGNAYVEVRRHFSSKRVEARRDSINFDARTGEILKDFQASPVRQIRTWMEGFHQARFDHWVLLWLYFIAGLSGCVLIATGFIFWLSSRRAKSKLKQPIHIKFVEAMSSSSTTGMVTATLAYFVINRLFHYHSEFLGLSQENFEYWGFFAVWGCTFIHAVARQKYAWEDHAWLIAMLCVTAVVLNWVTTGDHLLATAKSGLWSIFSMDLTLLVCALVSAGAARRLRSMVTG